MKKFLFVLISLAIFFSLFIFAHADDSIKVVTALKVNIAQYEVFELNIYLSDSYPHPYDPQKVNLFATFSAPDGEKIVFPAFYSGAERLWKLYYTPAKAGHYNYTVTLHTPNKTTTSDMYAFTVYKSGKDGFLRKNKNNPYYPVFDSGKPFFGIGHNLGWVTNNEVGIYKKYLIDMKNNGCNLARIWLNSHWTLNIETEKIGQYNISDCRRIDELVKAAEELGIYIIFSLDSYGSLMEDPGEWNEGVWRFNPYNKVNGGPCSKPWDFFANETAKKHYKNRLRYIISRWSHSPNIIAFELWNETDAPPEWAKEMFSFMKGINAHGQFTTTSLGYPWSNNFNESAIWNLHNLDIVQRHMYGNFEKDLLGSLIYGNKSFLKKYNKYVIVSEFGLNTSKDDKICDPNGDAIELHNSLWASAMSGSFSTALNWWWQSYIRPKNLYPHYKALSSFLSGTNWNSNRVKIFNTFPIKRKPHPKEKVISSDVTITTKEVWGDNRFKNFTILNNGDVEGGTPNYYLMGKENKHLKLEPTFNVFYPADGKFEIFVSMVSQNACLVVTLDDKEVIKKDFPAGPGEGPWKRSLYRKDHKIYQCIYDTTLSFDVPKGHHVVKLMNTGIDWLGIKSITLRNYSDSSFAKARAVGISVDDTILLWFQNKDYSYYCMKKNRTLNEFKNAYITVTDIANGNYKIEWWDTYKGELLFKNDINVEGNTTNIEIPQFTKDIACKLIKSTQ